MYLPTLAVVKSCQVMSWLLGGIQTLRGAVASDGISGTMAPGLAFGRRQGHGGKLRTADAMEKVGTDWEFGGMRTWTRRNHVSDSEWLAETGGEIPYHTHARRPGSGATAGWRHVEFGNGLDGARPRSGETEDGWQVGVVGSGLESRVVRVPQEPKLGGGGANGMSRAKPTRDGAIWKCSNRSAGGGCPTRCFGRLFGLTDWYWAGRPVGVPSWGLDEVDKLSSGSCS